MEFVRLEAWASWHAITGKQSNITNTQEERGPKHGADSHLKVYCFPRGMNTRIINDWRKIRSSEKQPHDNTKRITHSTAMTAPSNVTCAPNCPFVTAHLGFLCGK